MARDSKGLVNLDFVDAEISEIAKSISELTKRNFILDDKIRGKVTIISPTPVSPEEAYQAFISALEVKGFTIVKAGRLLKIVPLRDMKTLPIPTEVEHPVGGDDIFVTRLIPLNYISAAEIVKSLRGLVSKNGDLISYDPTNTLILTDNLSNLRRLIKLIDLLDQKGFQDVMEVIKLKYAPATDTADKIRNILDLKDQRGGQPPGAPQPAAGEGQGSQSISKIIPDERTNSLIVLANREGLRRVREIVEKIDQSIQNEIGKGRIHVHYLQYADAGELAATLASLSGGGGGGMRGGRPKSTAGSRPTGTMFPTPGGSSSPPPIQPSGPAGGAIASMDLFGGEVHITSDLPTNSLVITASPADYEALLPVIQKLDVRRPQAFVEAMILEVDIDKAFDFGTAMHLGTQFGDNNDTTLFGATSFGSTSSIFLPTDPSALGGMTVGLQGKTIDIPVAGGQTLTIPTYGAVFRALQTNGTVNVLSTPNILTKDNMEAEIIVGQVVPFITAQGRDVNNQPINQIQRENVAITLRVTPQINESDDITMDIFQEIQDLVPGPDVQTFGPTTSKRSAKTTVLVKDSQTVTVGGLISDQERNSISKVPVLGDIPIIGWFFKTKSKTKRKTSLAIFLTPHIIREPEDLESMTIRKNVERLRFLKENNVPDHPGLEKYHLDRELQAPKKLAPPTSRKPVPADGPTAAFLGTTEGVPAATIVEATPQ